MKLTSVYSSIFLPFCLVLAVRNRVDVGNFLFPTPVAFINTYIKGHFSNPLYYEGLTLLPLAIVSLVDILQESGSTCTAF